MPPILLHKLVAVAALAGVLAIAPDRAAASAALSPARAQLALAEADRVAGLGPMIGDEIAAATAWFAHASATLGRILSVTERADEVVPLLVRGTDRRSAYLLWLPRDGELGKAQTERLQSLMRCRRTGRTHEVSPGLIAILADLAAAFPGRGVEFISGYRPPPHGAPSSKHFHGHAVDIRIPGVPLEDVRDYLWREHTGIGLGYYPRQGFVHIDHRPTEPDIAWTATHEGASYRYHPGWARELRQDRRPHSRVGL